MFEITSLVRISFFTVKGIGKKIQKKLFFEQNESISIQILWQKHYAIYLHSLWI